MKKLLLLASILAVAPWLAPAVRAADVDPAMVTAAEKMLTTMPADFYMVEPPAAQQAIENAQPLVLDVREPAELVKDGSIAGSVHVPIRDLPRSLAKLPDNKSAPIITYCKVGYRGGMAVTILRMWGYTNVRTIKGGLEGWAKAGLPVEKKT